MRFAYADPPYFGCGKSHYGEHHPEAAVWDDQETHIDLVTRLVDEYPDGWVLSCNPRDLAWLLPTCPDDVRVAAWCKTWHQIRPTTTQFAWEPVIWRGGRKDPKRSPMVRDWMACAVTRQRGLKGAKPDEFNQWVLDLLAFRDRDLFCGAGGCSVGYNRAGFDVVGVDVNPQPRYPFEFHQADAMTYPLEGFDAVHASPPCQEHSALSSFRLGHDTGWMLSATRDRLNEWGGVYVIENVPGAPMPDSLLLCGASFGLQVNGFVLRRHRLFESNRFLMGPGCACTPRTLGVYGNGGGRRPEGHSKGWTASRAESKILMGIDWMTRAELAQAIPPAYTQHIGAQLIAHLESEAAA